MYSGLIIENNGGGSTSPSNNLIKGFTLIEILIVLTIIAILASLSITSYIKYQNKSKVTAYALPIVKACANEAIGYCGVINVSNPTQLDLNLLKTCTSMNVPIGSVELTINGTIICQPNGQISGGSITGSLQGITDYHAKCEFQNNSMRCTVAVL